jgi:acyl transferase domain-containing protein
MIACFNSPNNCTVSGDENKIDQLQTLLSADKVFARKLLVKNAYHSPHMQEVSNDYMALLGELPRVTSSVNGMSATRVPVEFFSTLRGQKVNDDEELSAKYWVDNLVSPVKFSKGLLEMVAGNVKRGQAAMQLNSAGRALHIDLMLEIGPHGALQSAIRENVATRPDAAIISTFSLLDRNNATAHNVLRTVGQLCARGYPVDLMAVNSTQGPNDVSSHGPSLLVNLPGYSFNHDERNMYESRLVRNYRLRKHPRHDLFGAPVPDWNHEHPRWRNFLSVEEQPWLRDHQVTGSIVFPAVGYLIAAVEALRQVTDPKEKIIGFRLRDVSIKRALVIPESMEGVEVMLSMNRMDESSLWGSQVWRRFHITSYNPVGDDWIEHCTGYIAADLATLDGPIDKGRERSEAAAAWQQTVDEVKGSCIVPFDMESIYDNLATSGLAFGSLFRNLSRAHGTTTNQGRVSGWVTVPDVAASMPKNFLHPHVVHPTTLDSMIQLLIICLMDRTGRKTMDRPMVPTFIKEVWLAADMDSAPGRQFFVHGKSEIVAFEKYEAEVGACDDLSGELQVTLKGIRAAFLDSVDNVASTGRALCHEMDWVPHLTRSPPLPLTMLPFPLQRTTKHMRIRSANSRWRRYC